MIFNINFDTWKQLLLPPKLANKLRLNLLLSALLEGAKTLHNKFLLFRTATLYKLKWTSQTIYLEKLLNERFNNGNPAFQNFELRITPVGIHIANPSSYKDAKYRWNKSENRVQVKRWNLAEISLFLLNKAFRYNDAELAANLDFVVKVPLSVLNVNSAADQSRLANMRAWIELYKIAGSRYTIENY